MGQQSKLEIIEQWRISPSPMPPLLSSLPLTFFDILFLRSSPVQRIYFFPYPLPKTEFLESDMPKLKQSLSICLHHFYPLAGNLVVIEGETPEIRCSKDDSVSVAIAISRNDFTELSGYHPRAVTDFHPLVPPLPCSGSENPVLAIQVTVFPNVGIAIGTTFHPAVADGSTNTHFMKLWASLCKTANPFGALPFYDRAAVHESGRVNKIYLKALEDPDTWHRPSRDDDNDDDDVVRATFVFGREKLERLRSKTRTGCCRYSLTCGYIWHCLVRTRGVDRSRKTERFGFVTGCRARHDPPLPAAYFGNCLGICHVEVPGSDLAEGEKGGAVAAEAIWKVICELPERVFARVENWIGDVSEYRAAKALTVGGSPKLGVYGVDFGWGRPRKVEMISIETTGAVSLAESRDEEGGIEVGVVLAKDEMEEFVSVFDDGFLDVQ